MMSTIWPITNQLRGGKEREEYATQWAMEYFQKRIFYILTQEMIPEEYYSWKMESISEYTSQKRDCVFGQRNMTRINKP